MAETRSNTRSSLFLKMLWSDHERNISNVFSKLALIRRPSGTSTTSTTSALSFRVLRLKILGVSIICGFLPVFWIFVQWLFYCWLIWTIKLLFKSIFLWLAKNCNQKNRIYWLPHYLCYLIPCKDSSTINLQKVLVSFWH